MSRPIIALTLLTLLLLLVGGCMNKPAPDNHTTAPSQVPDSPTKDKSLMFDGVKIPQAEGVNPDYIRMSSDIYIQGEVIEFNIVNGGSESLMCRHTLPPYSLYRQTGSWEPVIKPTGTQTSWGSELKPGDSTQVQQLSTAYLTPGHYKLATGCGVSREFEIRAVSGADR